MTYENYKNEIVARLQPTLRCVGLSPVFKPSLLNNGITTEMLCLKDIGCGFAFQVRLEESFRNHDNVEDVVNSIAQTVYEYYNPHKNIEKIQDCLAFEFAKPRIVASLVNADANEMLLARRPYKHFLDLAIVFYILLEQTTTGLAKIQVSNELMEIWGIDVEELYRTAMSNLPKLLPFRLIDINRNIIGMEPDFEVPDHMPKLFAMTNTYGAGGAIACLYPGALQQVADKLKTNFVVFPSSVHEMIAAPLRSDDDVQDYKNLLLACNGDRNVVKADDLLSNQLYYYDCAQDCLRMFED